MSSFSSTGTAVGGLSWAEPKRDGHHDFTDNATGLMKPKTRARLNRSKSPEITQTKLGLPSIDPPLGALPVGLGTPSPQIAPGSMRLLVN